MGSNVHWAEHPQIHRLDKCQVNRLISLPAIIRKLSNECIRLLHEYRLMAGINDVSFLCSRRQDSCFYWRKQSSVRTTSIHSIVVLNVTATLHLHPFLGAFVCVDFYLAVYVAKINNQRRRATCPLGRMFPLVYLFSLLGFTFFSLSLSADGELNVDAIYPATRPHSFLPTGRATQKPLRETIYDFLW